MKDQLLIVFLTALTYQQVVVAKESYTVTEDHNLKTPRVRDYACKACVFDDGDNHWCIESDFTVNAGWEFVQDYVDTEETPSYDL